MKTATNVLAAILMLGAVSTASASNPNDLWVVPNDQALINVSHEAGIALASADVRGDRGYAVQQANKFFTPDGDVAAW